MKTIADKLTRDALTSRINMLKQGSTAQWGKMNAYQMVRHCRLWEEMISGERPNKRVLVGYIFGKIALKSVLKDDSPLGRNSPTTPELRIKETDGDFATEKSK